MFASTNRTTSALVSSFASVTQQLRAASGSPVLAEIIQEGYRRPTHAECRILQAYDLSTQTCCWTREVLLRTAGKYKALARIIVPADEVDLIPWICRLGSQPLGEVLFDAYSPRRENIRCDHSRFSGAARRFSLRAREVALSIGFENKERYWSRSSVLRVSGQRSVHCVVTEIFFD